MGSGVDGHAPATAESNSPDDSRVTKGGRANPGIGRGITRPARSAALLGTGAGINPGLPFTSVQTRRACAQAARPPAPGGAAISA